MSTRGFISKTKNIRPASIVYAMAIAMLAYGVLPMACAWRTPKPETETHQSDEPQRRWIPTVWSDFMTFGPTAKHLPDFSYAGYAMGDRPIPQIQGPVFDVTHPRFGAVPNDGRDDTESIQSAIDAAGGAGGGVVLIPRGRFEIHTTTNGKFLRIAHDRIVLRGQGSGRDGTILHLGAPAPAIGVRRLGSVPAEDEARHGAIVTVTGAETRSPLASYTADVRRGSRVIRVSDSGLLAVGSTVIVEFTDPLIDSEHPSADKVDLAAQLTAPFRFVAGQTDSFGAMAKTHTWIVQVDKIIDRHTIRLSKPARFDQWLRYRPRIYSFEGVHQVGIENLHFQSSWPGNYRHHKPFLDAEGKIVRSAKEQDYLWNGIWISSAVDCWVRDVAFEDLTQGIVACRSAQITVQDTKYYGLSGHAGVTIGHSNDLLVRGADFYARMVHPLTVTIMASGNVFTDCRAHYEGRNDYDATDAAIDFHGLFPYENLFEKLEGFYVCPGGDLSVLPHAGVRNVFWHIRAPLGMSCYCESENDEFARSYDLASTSSKTTATMFEHFPQAFYIGIQRDNGLPLAVGASASDRTNSWMTVEGLGRGDLAVPSLYQAQRQFRTHTAN